MTLITTAPFPLCFLSFCLDRFSCYQSFFNSVYCLHPPHHHRHPPTMSLHLLLCSFLVSLFLSIFRMVDQQQKAQHECFSSCDNYSIVQYLNRLLSHTHTSAVLLSKIRLNLNFPDITQHLSHSSTVMLSNYILKQCSKVVGCRQL